MTNSPVPDVSNSTAPAGSASTLPLDPFAGMTASELPNSADAVAALLKRFPASIGGEARSSVTPRGVSYGSATSVSVAPLGEAAGPGVTMPEFYKLFTNSGQFHIAAHQANGSHLLWFVGTPSSGSGAAAAVANSAGTWLFGFEAPDGARLGQLLKAFRAAAH